MVSHWAITAHLGIQPIVNTGLPMLKQGPQVSQIDRQTKPAFELLNTESARPVLPLTPQQCTEKEREREREAEQGFEDDHSSALLHLRQGKLSMVNRMIVYPINFVLVFLFPFFPLEFGGAECFRTWFFILFNKILSGDWEQVGFISRSSPGGLSRRVRKNFLFFFSFFWNNVVGISLPADQIVFICKFDSEMFWPAIFLYTCFLNLCSALLGRYGVFKLEKYLSFFLFFLLIV